MIQPGVQQAQLTLPDGSIIDVHKKEVNVIVDGVQVKYKEGVLSYEPTVTTQHEEKNVEEKPVKSNELIIPRGGENTVILADGTTVHLNAGSKLTYPVRFAGKRRIVALEGEAYFEVVQDESHPFVVQTHLGEVMVLGTAFNVNAYTDASVCYTTLVHGKVQFSAPNVGTVTVPDSRIDALVDMYEPDKTTYAVIEFVDIAGLVKGASHGEGLGNKFLSNIREVDAIVHVVRAFEDENIVHVEGSVDPVRDIETINLELILSDIEILDRRIDKTKKSLKGGDKTFRTQLEFYERLREHLESGKCARAMSMTEDEIEMLADVSLLTLKPVIYAANVAEDDYAKPDGENEYVNKIREFAATENSEVMVISAKIEEEIAALDKDEKQVFLEELGADESGLDKLVRASYKLLGLISYLTAGKPEVRAWTITKGTKAPQAAGKIHTDFERGFIRAEVVAFDDLMKCGSMNAAKEKGLVRSEGKEYVVNDGDIILFRFNV